MSFNKITILFILLIVFTLNCKLNEPDEQLVLKSYRTLTPVTVTADMVDLIINSLNFPEFNDNQIQNLTIFPVKVYKITYRTKYKGDDVIASGAVTIPEGDGQFPILSYHHGTIFKDSRAPSKYNGTTNMEAETALNIMFGSTGFICSAPDLIGYGDSTDLLHPYHLFSPNGTASIDMLRAVKELCAKLDVKISGEYFITGYSEGAYTAMAVQREIQKNNGNEFPVIASSLGAGAYYLSETIKRMIDGRTLVSPAYPAFLFSAYNEYYGWGRNLSEIFSSPYSNRLVDGILYGNLTQLQIDDLLTSKTTALFTPTFLSNFRGSGEEQLKSAFIENDLYSDWAPEILTILFHGTWDNIVPPFNSESAIDAFRQKGSGFVEYIPLHKKDHDTAIMPWIKATILWFNSI